MTTSGPRTTTDTTLATPTPTDVLPPRHHGPVTLTTRTVATGNPPPRPTALATGANPAPTGTPGVAIRTTRRMSPTTRCRPRPTPPSPTTSGTTRTTTSGAPRLGARTE